MAFRSLRKKKLASDHLFGTVSLGLGVELIVMTLTSPPAGAGPRVARGEVENRNCTCASRDMDEYVICDRKR